jgi:hypothetical protein
MFVQQILSFNKSDGFSVMKVPLMKIPTKNGEILVLFEFYHRTNLIALLLTVRRFLDFFFDFLTIRLAVLAAISSNFRQFSNAQKPLSNL